MYFKDTKFSEISEDGLSALKTLDSNKDGKFNVNDAKFNNIKIWQDKQDASII
jgi:hypothetical protein